MQFPKNAPRPRVLACLVAAILLSHLWPAAGQSFSITNFNVALSGPRTIGFSADADSYYILYRGQVVTNISEPVKMALGISGSLTLQDSSSQTAAQFYRVARVPLLQPLDSDGDGIDDVFELSYAGCLNPLDPTDASLDCDGDTRSNLQEYFDGTNPILADAAPKLVINEIDYDQVGSPDTAEFVEILNKGTNTINLAHYALAFINGANNLEYLRVNLNGPISASQYLVVASTNLTTIPAAARIIYFLSGENSIQNGSPDGVALINTGSLTIQDAFCYKGAMTAANINGFSGTRTLVEGTALSASVADSNTAAGSLARIPDGADTDNASADWTFSSTPTPGAANVP
ncbi:MAG TPA: lamin tail domain-containing protein [Candidatus Dormibacteraeota bacterium]|nr:lamin tail domain-containing protein [Candidatus Dormibacteraeota bacterium]